MMRSIGIALAASTLIALVPAPTAQAACPPDVQDCYVIWSVDVQGDLHSGYTVYLVRCNLEGGCMTSRLIGTGPCTTACNAYVIPRVRSTDVNEADGSVTVTYALCNERGFCQPDSTLTTGPTIPIPDDACFEYTPEALTNACIEPTPKTVHGPGVTPGSEPKTVDVPVVGTNPTRVCIIGPECVTVPVPTLGTEPRTVDVPTATVDPDGTPVTLTVVGGYVEVTVACGLNVPCRVNA